jgi:hypothetical protein
MKRSILGFTLAGLVLCTGAVFAGEGGTWVADSDKVHQLRHGNAVFVSDEDAERFDLSELRDGETRVFGSGPRAVTATRSGDSVSLTRASSGDDVSRIDVNCEIQSDTCTVLTFPSEPDKVMVAIEKERVCVNGEGDCDHAFGTVSAMGHVVVDIDCDGDEDCESIHTMKLDEMLMDETTSTFTVDVEALAGDEGEPSRIVIRRTGVGGEGDNVWVSGGPHSVRKFHGNQVMLRCSEGDATITVEKDEAEETFLCPKHSTPMVKVSGHSEGIHVIQSPDIRIKRETRPHEH